MTILKLFLHYLVNILFSLLCLLSSSDCLVPPSLPKSYSCPATRSFVAAAQGSLFLSAWLMNTAKLLLSELLFFLCHADTLHLWLLHILSLNYVNIINQTTAFLYIQSSFFLIFQSPILLLLGKFCPKCSSVLSVLLNSPIMCSFNEFITFRVQGLPYSQTLQLFFEYFVDCAVT